MLYDKFTENELERTLYIDPANVAAQTEMLRRAPGLISKRNQDVEQAEADLATATSDHESEVEGLRDDLEESERWASDLQNELDEANDRIAELTCSEDLI